MARVVQGVVVVQEQFWDICQADLVQFGCVGFCNLVSLCLVIWSGGVQVRTIFGWDQPLVENPIHMHPDFIQ